MARGRTVDSLYRPERLAPWNASGMVSQLKLGLGRAGLGTGLGGGSAALATAVASSRGSSTDVAAMLCMAGRGGLPARAARLLVASAALPPGWLLLHGCSSCWLCCA
jgi:hypothetical protein